MEAKKWSRVLVVCSAMKAMVRALKGYREGCLERRADALSKTREYVVQLCEEAWDSSSSQMAAMSLSREAVPGSELAALRRAAGVSAAWLSSPIVAARASA